eukprot:scaffold2.g7468.t1
MPTHTAFITGAGGRTGKLVFQKRPEQAAQLGPGTIVGDVLRPETYEQELASCQKLVILTSAVPKMRPRDNPSDPPEWYFEDGGEPEKVDWEGQRLQIDLARKHGLQQVVLVSSMGVTRPDRPLNRIGQILTWKRRAEEYLVNQGVPYTIIHAGGLIDEPGGRRKLVVGAQRWRS